MTRELEIIKQFIKTNGGKHADILLERNDFLLVRWNNVPDMPERFYCLHAYPYSKSGMGNCEPWRYDITERQAEYFLGHPDEAEEYFKSKHRYFRTAEVKKYSFDCITAINENGIGFKDGRQHRTKTAL